MLVSLLRIIKYGIQSFLRNGWLSASTISIMILALIVFEGLILFNHVSTTAMRSIQEKVDIRVSFKTNVPEDSILNVKRSIESLEEVNFVEYVSREEALENFRAEHADDERIIQTLEELDDNPLRASLDIKAKELEQYSTIASYLETPSLQDLVEEVSYAKNQIVIERLSSIIKNLNRGILILTTFLTFLAVIVTFNTIRLAIFANSEQISIMRLVGASNSFIRGPFMIEGIIDGILAALVSFGMFIPIINIVSPRLTSFVRELDLAGYFTANWQMLLTYQIIFALGLSIISSYIAVRRYLRK
jgi:cell division transport system permease protein